MCPRRHGPPLLPRPPKLAGIKVLGAIFLHHNDPPIPSPPPPQPHTHTHTHPDPRTHTHLHTQGDIKVLGAMLAGGREVLSQVVNERGQSALHFAAALGRPDLVRLLLEAGADGNLQDKDGYTPLHMVRVVQGGGVGGALVSACRAVPCERVGGCAATQHSTRPAAAYVGVDGRRACICACARTHAHTKICVRTPTALHRLRATCTPAR